MRNSPEVDKKSPRKRPPATTPEARENQMISLAFDLAEKRLLNGTATSQEVTHFLKLASSKERLEKEMLTQQVELVKAKTEAIRAAEDIKELYMNALDAMRTYSGNRGGNDD